MGGMQALQWAVSHPASCSVVAMTPMAQTDRGRSRYVERARVPAWPTRRGTATVRLPSRARLARLAALMSALLMRTPAALARRISQSAQADCRGRQRPHRGARVGFDAHDCLYQSWAYEAHDVGATPGFGGDTMRALASIRARDADPGATAGPLQSPHRARARPRRSPARASWRFPRCRATRWGTEPRERRRRVLNATIVAFLRAHDGGAQALVLLWLFGICLRITVLAIPPVIPLIHESFALSQSAVGALTSLPVLLFSFAALPGSLLVARFGAAHVLTAGILLCGIASGAARTRRRRRRCSSRMTFVMGVGIAIMQPALPAVVRDWVPRRVALGTAVYSNALLVGEAISASLTIPVVLPRSAGAGAGASWSGRFRWSRSAMLAAWATRTARRPPAPARPPRRWWPDWSDPLTWKLGLIAGFASSLYFAHQRVPARLPRRTAAAPTCWPALSALNWVQIRLGPDARVRAPPHAAALAVHRAGLASRRRRSLGPARHGRRVDRRGRACSASATPSC